MTPSKQRKIAAPPEPRPRIIRTVFLSLPANPEIREYVEGDLAPAVRNHFDHLRPISYLDMKIGRWLPAIEHDIARCNAMVAFISDHNPNVMIELGRAMALGKPIIPVSPSHQDNASMLEPEQITMYDGPLLTARVTQKIIDSIHAAIFTVLERERSDARMRMQKRLLLGARTWDQRSDHQPSREIKPVPKTVSSRAWSEFQAGQFLNVIKILSPVARRRQSEDLCHLLADTWFLYGESTQGREAVSCYAQMQAVAELGLNDFPGSFLLRKDRGLALMKLGDFSGAEAQFSELATAGENPIVTYNLACANALLGERFQALSFLNRAIELQPYYQELARVDPDFDPLWEDTLFQALVFQARVA
jgi:tetratricopeptide (TPR) repeat protein